MTHRFPIKEIARQAGLGTATVDRVLNDRPNVSRQTRNRVIAALDELESQEQQLAARGMRLFVDIVVEAPKRFSNEVRNASEAALTGFSSGVLRPRFIFQEKMSDDEIVGILKRIASRGSHGVCLKARDIQPVRHWVDKLEAAGTPVVTLVTDIPQTRRSAYVGLDNENAGRTAAYLLARTLPRAAGTILATRSNETFYGEIERFTRFCETLSSERPELRVVDVSVGAGLQWETVDRLDSVLKQITDLAAVYSMGGGNAAILKALQAHRQVSPVFIAHDLDNENRRLIRDGSLSYVLHHDLAADMRNVFLAIASHHGLAPAIQRRFISDIQIVTPFNIPGE